MPIDPYSPCPGGTGKKIKFCCSDLVGELEKIQRMLEGDQRAACLDHIESIEAKYPERACLLSTKAMLQAQLGQEKQAEETLGTFLAKYPDNPVALAEKATLVAASEGGVAALTLVQQALESCVEQIPAQVYDAIGLVAQILIAENQVLAGRGHLILQLGFSGSQDQQPLQLLMRVNNSSSIPLVAKQEFPLLPAPEDALWKSAFQKALEPAMRGCWRKGAAQLTELAKEVGEWPAIRHNVAVLRTWLADTPGAIAAWRHYAAADIPLDDAVEAEAMAQTLDPEAVDLVDLVSVEYELKDIEVAQAQLAASPLALHMPVDLSQMGSEDQPPPKTGFWLLSRDVPESAAGLTPADVPQVVGQVFVYGKQTDRAARVELAAYRPQLEQGAAKLTDIVGDALGPQGESMVRTEVPALQHALTTNWRLPSDTSPEKRRELVEAQRHQVLLNVWPEMPQKIFGGKSASEIAGDKDQQIKLLAAVLLLEMATDAVAAEFDYNELRRKLGCPVLGPIDPSTVNLAELPLLRLARVEVKKLNDDQLIDLYRRADHYRHVAALRKLAPEVAERPSLDGKIDKSEVYGLLAQIEPDSSKVVALLNQARTAAEAAGKSTAPWDLTELAMRIGEGEVAEADKLLHHIRDEHIREPGVAQALFQILSDAGIIGPDGKPAVPGGGAGEASPLASQAAPAAEAGKIWTPGGDEPSGGGKKSGIWTPD